MKLMDRFLTEAFKKLLNIRYDIYRAENTADLAGIKADCVSIGNHIVARSNPQIKQFCLAMEYLCDCAFDLLEKQNFSQAFDFIDAFHGLPLIFLKNRYSVPEKFFTLYVSPYSRKWGPESEMRFRAFFRTVPNPEPVRLGPSGSPD